MLSLLAVLLSTAGDAFAQAPASALPLLSLDTQAEQGGTPGVSLGGQFLSADGSVGDPRLQLVAVDRTDGTVIANDTVGGASFAAAAGAAIDALPTGDTLAIVVSHPGWGSWEGADAELSGMGVQPAIGAPTHAGGSFSAVGVVGGQAAAQQRAWSDGRITGALVLDQLATYGFTWGAPVRFSVTHDGQLSVGSSSYDTGAAPDGAAGYDVWRLHSQDLSLIAQRRFVIDPASPGPTLDDLTAWLEDTAASASRELVVVSSFGTPAAAAAAAPTDWLTFTAVLESLGATAPMLTVDGIERYVLVAQRGRSVEVVPRPALAEAPVGGQLHRGADGTYGPRYTGAAIELPSGLVDTLFQPDEPFAPWTGGEAEAYAHISGRVHSGEGGDDLRVNYYANPDWDWAAVRSEVQSYSYPSPPPSDYTELEFETVKNALIAELGHVATVAQYLRSADGLQSPWSADATQLATMVQTAADQISASVSSESEGEMVFADVLEGALDVAYAADPESMDAVGLVAAVLGMGLDVGGDVSQGGGSVDPVTVSKDTLATTLQGRFQAAIAGMDRMYDIVVSDAGKLREVGTMAMCTAGAPGCTADWQWNDSDSEAAFQALSGATLLRSYSALLPAEYQLAAIDAGMFGGVTTANGVPCAYQDGVEYYPFREAPATGQLALPATPAIGSPLTIFAMTAGKRWDGIEKTPQASFTDQLRQLVLGGGTPSTTGYELDWVRFLLRSMPAVPFECAATAANPAPGWSPPPAGDDGPPHDGVPEAVPPAPAPPPAADPTPSPPDRGPRRTVEVSVRSATVVPARRRLVVRGRLDRRAGGRVVLRYRARIGGQRRTRTAAARVRRGRFVARLTLPGRWRQARAARVTLRYTGTRRLAPAKTRVAVPALRRAARTGRRD